MGRRFEWLGQRESEVGEIIVRGPDGEMEGILILTFNEDGEVCCSYGAIARKEK